MILPEYCYHGRRPLCAGVPALTPSHHIPGLPSPIVSQFVPPSHTRHWVVRTEAQFECPTVDIQPPTQLRRTHAQKNKIHTHALLEEVTQYLIENGTMRVEMLSAYEALGTHPSSVYKSKQDHSEAIFALTSAIELCLTEPPTHIHERPVTRHR